MPAKITKTAQKADAQTEVHPLLEPVRKVLLASIGAVALAQDEIEDFVVKLVERGQIAEKDGKKLMRDLMERSKKEAKVAEEDLDKRVEDILGRMNIPTKSDIQALNAKITTLAKKIDELQSPS